jgi:Fe-S-cluster-containing dehydrogenase component
MTGAGFILDLGRCVGCGACVLACRLENRWPEGVSWRRLLPLNLDRFAGGPTYHFSLACHHCERPACLTACPSGAYEKRLDGVVLLRQEFCLGCRYCAMACPYGAPSYDEAAGVMTKCHLCAHRLDIGLRPACVAACPTEALLFRRTGTELETVLRQGETLRIPGFSGAAGCEPNTRFVPPRGRIRNRRLQELGKELKQ